MEDVLKAAEELKAHVLVLLNDNHQNRARILLLEKRLDEYEDKDRRPDANVSKPPSGIACDVKNDKSFQALEKKFADLEQTQQQQQQQQQRQYEDTQRTLQRLDKLQLLLNGVLLKKTQTDQTDRQMDVKSDVDSLLHMVDDLKAKTDGMCSENINQVKERRLPLSRDDYEEMTALEYLADVTDGPAFKWYINCWYGDSDKAERLRQEKVKYLRDRGFKSPEKAMEEYNKMCGLTHAFSADTEFYPIYDITNGTCCILAINQTGLKFVDQNTKKLISQEDKSWAWDDFRACVEQVDCIELTLTDGNTLLLDTDENINKELCQKIGRKIGK